MLAMVRRLEQAHSGALPVNAIAQELDVNRRTVVRWLLALEREWLNDDGEPIVCREHRSGEAWAVLTGATTVLSANIFQYAAALAATRHLEVGGGSLLSESAADVLNRVEEGMSPTLREYLPRVLQSFHYVPFAAKDHRISEDTLDVLVRALIRRHPVEVDYTNAAGNTSHQRLQPWSMVMYRDGFYLLARHPGHTALRLYAVERMGQVSLDRSVTFDVPKDFNPETEFGRNLGLWRTQSAAERVVIAFDSTVAPIVSARRWPGFQSLEEAPDGRVHLVLEVPVTPEIKTWVLGWGAVAEVLEPPQLREIVAAEIAVAASRYAVP
jgi:predicted DNA-binding transcriptional regulator YafY